MFAGKDLLSQRTGNRVRESCVPRAVLDMTSKVTNFEAPSPSLAICTVADITWTATRRRSGASFRSVACHGGTAERVRSASARPASVSKNSRAARSTGEW